MADLGWRDIRQGTTSPADDDPTLLQTFDAGAFRVNANPVTMATGLLGWFCTVSGHPGTWIELWVTPGVSTAMVPDSFMVFCVDYDAIICNGTGGFGTSSDTTGRPGYSAPLSTPTLTMAAALAAAKLTPFKTLEGVGKRLPRWGNNGTVVVLVKPRTSGATYRNIANTADEDMNWWSQLAGWKRRLARPTHDFVNDSNDKINAGFQVVSGTNAAGYSCGATSSTSNLANILTAAGAAPAFVAQTNGQNALTFKRIRFLNTTPTVALRNATSGIWYNTSTGIVPSDNLPAVPAFVSAGHASNDLFVIEEPGWQMGAGTFSAPNAGLSFNGSSGGAPSTLVGVRFTATSIPTGPGSLAVAGFEMSAGTLAPTNLADFVAKRTYEDELGTSIAVGTGYRIVAFQPVNVGNVVVSSSCETTRASVGWFGVSRFQYGACCFSGHGMQHDSSPAVQPTMTTLNGAGKRVGSTGSATQRRFRISSPTSAPGIEAVASMQIRGVDISGCVGPAIRCIGSPTVSIDDVVSTDGGNTDVVLDMSTSFHGVAVVGAITANTITATAGEIKMSGPALGTLASLAATNLTDNRGNDVIGSGGKVV